MEERLIIVPIQHIPEESMCNISKQRQMLRSADFRFRFRLWVDNYITQAPANAELHSLILTFYME
jgi:hypothetical protein